MFSAAGIKTKKSEKIDYNSLPIPKGYIAGLGRGVTGFVTRSDIGPGTYTPGEDNKNAFETKETNINEDSYDEFIGSDAGALAQSGAYEEDDREADSIWDAVEEFIIRKRHRPFILDNKLNRENTRGGKERVVDYFIDIKKQLTKMTYEDWEAIPDVKDYSIKRRKCSRVHLRSRMSNETNLKNSFVPANAGATLTRNLAAVGKGRGTVLTYKLDRAADFVTGQTVLDPKGYVTELKSIKVNTESEVSDIKKARLLLKSLIGTNPKHGSGWIAAARLEEVDGRLRSARFLIMKGLNQCRNNEDVWIEASRLQNLNNSRVLLMSGVRQIPKSVKLWLLAANLEKNASTKLNIIQKALEAIPGSIRLWKAAIDLAKENEARILLSRAVERCPQHIELWLALTKLETYANARKVLNKARQIIPSEPQIWFSAAKLEETHGNGQTAEKIIHRGIKSLKAHGVIIDRDVWIKEAELAESLNPPMLYTCRAIVKAVINHGIDDQDTRVTWLADAEESLKRRSIETARTIFSHALRVHPMRKEFWFHAADLERRHGARHQLHNLLGKAVQYCPQATKLWLMAAKEKWRDMDVNGARLILAEAFTVHGDSEDIWIAAFKLEFETLEIKRARKILEKARMYQKNASARIWMKSAIIERLEGNSLLQRRLLKTGLQKHPTFWKLWLMLAQLEEQQGQLYATRQAFVSGLNACSDRRYLWLNYSSYEEKKGSFSKARAILERGCFERPNDDKLWLAAVRLENRAKKRQIAEYRLARALRECPRSGMLWSHAIDMAERSQQKSKCADAIKFCDNNPHVFCAMARIFWSENKLQNARNWFMRAVASNPDIGDIWGFLYNFELQHGTVEQQKTVIEKCQMADPRHGELWCKISKNISEPYIPTRSILITLSNELKTLIHM
jgi:pre-mRNA-processing factor 6